MLTPGFQLNTGPIPGSRKVTWHMNSAGGLCLAATVIKQVQHGLRHLECVPIPVATAPPTAALLVFGKLPPHTMVSLGLSTSGLGPAATQTSSRLSGISSAVTAGWLLLQTIYKVDNSATGGGRPFTAPATTPVPGPDPPGCCSGSVALSTHVHLLGRCAVKSLLLWGHLSAKQVCRPTICMLATAATAGLV